MRLVLASLLLAGCASAPVAPPSPPPVAEAPKTGAIEISQTICMHGIFGFHFKTDAASEGNAYMPLRLLAALCRQNQEEDEAQPQSDDKPLPKGTEKL